MQPKVGFPASQIVGAGASALTNTSSAVVGNVPTTIGGAKPAFIRVTAFNLTPAGALAAVHFRLAATATSATCATSDSIVYSGESLFLNTLGNGAWAALGVIGNVRVQISPLEEGVILPTGQAGGIG